MKKSISVMAYTFSGFALQANLNNAQMVSLGKISNIDNLNIYILVSLVVLLITAIIFALIMASRYKKNQVKSF
jgi:hypothetical protein